MKLRSGGAGGEVECSRELQHPVMLVECGQNSSPAPNPTTPPNQPAEHSPLLPRIAPHFVCPLPALHFVCLFVSPLLARSILSASTCPLLPISSSSRFFACDEFASEDGGVIRLIVPTPDSSLWLLLAAQGLELRKGIVCAASCSPSSSIISLLDTHAGKRSFEPPITIYAPSCPLC